MRIRPHMAVWLGLALVLLSGPVAGQEPDLSTDAGLEALHEAQRQASGADIGLPDRFALELVAQDLSFPSAVAVGPDGDVYVAISGFGGSTPEIVRIGAEGASTSVASDGLGGPITGIHFAPDGTFYVTFAGSVATIDLATGSVTPVLTDLPGMANHQNNHLAFGSDDWVYFGIGSATNSMVVGLDDILSGWVQENPDASDVPCEDITIAAEPFVTTNPLTEDASDQAMTSPYHPFDTAVEPGTVVAGETKCTGSVLRFKAADPEGSLEVFAWGFRNPYSVAVDEDGTVFVVENGADVRGSRPIANAPDVLWRIEQDQAGAWFGYPDFVAGLPVTDPTHAAPGVQPLGFLIEDHAGLLGGAETPLEPFATWVPHDATAQAAFVPDGWEQWSGRLLVTHHGDFAPVVGPLETPLPGKVDAVDVGTGELSDLFVNPAPGPSGGAPERPVALAFSDGSLYVADLGVIEGSTAGLIPRPRTGAIWRISPQDQG